MAGTPRDIATLESWFETGDKPTQQQFYDLFASMLHYSRLKQNTGNSTSDIMSQKAVTDALTAISTTLSAVLTTGNDAGAQQIKNLLDPTLAQDADTLAARNAAISTAMSALMGGVGSNGDTLNKLYNLITSLGEFAGNHDATTGLPTFGTGIAGAIDKGDYWYVTTPGSIADLGNLKIGDVIFAKVSAANVSANFFYLPFASLVVDASESVKGIVEEATKTELLAANSIGATGAKLFITPSKFKEAFTDIVDLGNISGAVSIDLSLARNFKCVATANITSFTFTNEVVGAVYYLDITRNTTNFTIAFTAGKFRFPLAQAPVLTNPTTNGSSPASATDTLVFKCGVVGRLDVVITPDLQNN